MDIKQLMLEYFERPQINSKILAYVNERHLRYQSLTNDQLMNILDELHILEPLLEEIEGTGGKKQYGYDEVSGLEEIDVGNGLRNLKVWVEKGRKFKNWVNNAAGDKFFISIAGFGQKFKTTSKLLSENFTIGQNYTFKVENKQLKVENSQALELAVVIQTKQGTRRLQSIKLVQWRYILAHGSVTFDMQLAPYIHQGIQKLPSLGILSLKLQLTPFSNLSKSQPTQIDRQLQLQLKQRQKYNTQFYSYANIFWNEYKQIHKLFQSRRIKIYGDSDDKIFIPLCRFVCPLYNVRGIDSPQHALRFVSLLPFEQEHINRQASHKRFHSFIAGMQGTVDDHCHLLCSLLLGFGLKAYVCIGYSYKGQHSWVLTQDPKNSSIIFWQATKGTKLDIYSAKTLSFYKSIHLVYNNNQFYANIQEDDTIMGTKYKFKDNTLWKSMQTQFLDNIPLYNVNVALSYPTFDVFRIQNNLEDALYGKVEEMRRVAKLAFRRDDILASILATALANYEIQRVTGLTFCQTQFENAIKNYIPPKHTFKAFPIQLTTLDPDTIIQQLKNQQKCREILLSNGDNVHFGIRTKLVMYPDNIFALWISIGVRFFKIA